MTRDEILKKPTIDQSSKSTKPPPNKPLSYEELLRIAQQQKDKKKSLEEEIEELATKKPKNDREELKKKEELYQQSLTKKRKMKTNCSNVEPIKSSSSKFETVTSSQRNHQSNSQSNFRKPISEFKFTRKSIDDKPSSKHQLSKKEDLPPISQVIKQRSNERFEQSKDKIESILNSNTTSGNLASKIANLSKEQLLELSRAVKRAKKVKMNSERNDEYSPLDCDNYDEYRPGDFKSSIKNSTSHKSTNEPVYVPTKIQNNRHQTSDEYCPLTNYKSSSTDRKPISSTQTHHQSKSNKNKLFDIDSLTPEEIEKIRKERLEKQQKLDASKSATNNDRLKSVNSKQASSSQFKSSNYQPTKSRTSTSQNRSNYLPPIGANYRRGDYDSNYNTSYADYDEYDEEDDDDMRDFIDDGDDYETSEDVSKAIQELFPRYNKRKFQFLDDDDIEESSYAQQMKEEFYSSREAKREDLEEELKERAEKKRKLRLGLMSSDEDD